MIKITKTQINHNKNVISQDLILKDILSLVET